MPSNPSSNAASRYGYIPKEKPETSRIRTEHQHGHRSRSRSRSRGRRRDRHSEHDRKRRRSYSSSSSSSSSSYCSTCSSSSGSHSLVSCSTCSGYYTCSTCSSSSRSRSRTREVSHKDHQVKVRMYVKDDISRKESGFGKLEIVNGKVGDPSIGRCRDPRKGKCPTQSLEPIYLEPDTNFVYKDPPSCLLIDKLSPSIKSKAQLYGLLEKHFGPTVSQAITDIEMFQKNVDIFASVKFTSGSLCYKVFFDYREQFKSQGWAVFLDRDQIAYKRKIALIEHLAAKELVKPKPDERDRRDGHDRGERRDDRDRHESRYDREIRDNRRHHEEAPVYTCVPDITCLLIDYDIFSYKNRSDDLRDIFKPYRLRNVERHRDCWHVHLEDEDAVEEAYSNRYSLEYNGRRIRPFLQSAVQPRPVEKKPDPVPAKRRDDDLDRIRNIVLEKTFVASTTPSRVRIFEPPVRSAAIDGFVNLPTFNKKYLEKLQELAEASDTDDAADERVDDVDDRADYRAADIVDERETIHDVNIVQLAEVTRVESIQLQPVQEKKRRTRKRSEDLKVDEPLAADEVKVPEVQVGSCRLMGYVKQDSMKKVVWFEPILPEDPSSLLSAKRSARSGGRRNDSTMAELVGKMSSLHLRQKQVILGRSSIHSYGLFSGEYIEPGDLVIEYVGEIIRHSLANIRERKLEEQLKAAGSKEMASSYFFRLDLTYVVDATHTGNLARFINHSCDPNCTAKVVQLEGTDHIVFYARKPISRGDEITYDYKFAIEDDPRKKIACLCGMPACRKYLN